MMILTPEDGIGSKSRFISGIMKRTITTLLFLMMVCVVEGQFWAPAGATWYFSINNSMSTGYMKVEYVSDTLVQGKICKALERTQYVYTWPGYYDTTTIGKIFTYAEGGKVYYFSNNEFYTLYDFDAPPGSTWKVHGLGNLDTGRVHVDSVGTMVLQNDTLRWIAVSPVSGSCIGWWSGKIVERIGNINEYLFPQYVDCVMDANEAESFRCYSDQTFPLFKMVSGPCDEIIQGLNELSQENTLQIYPLPATHTINADFRHPTVTIEYFEIFSPQGTKVASYSCQPLEPILANISGLKPGVYLIIFYSSDGNAITKKLIKQ